MRPLIHARYPFSALVIFPTFKCPSREGLFHEKSRGDAVMEWTDSSKLLESNFFSSNEVAAKCG